MTDRYLLNPIGRVESSLLDRENAPRQADEGAPEAWLAFSPSVEAALADLVVGSDVLLLTWLDRASRDVLSVHPRGDLTRPATGVFSTRSPDRPNPIGLHKVKILEISGHRVRVANLEAIHGTPILDIKPILDAIADR